MFVFALTLAGCGSSGPAGPTKPDALLTTLNDLAVFGEKRVGTPTGLQASQYVEDRFHKVGLGDVHTEGFTFPRHDVISSSLNVTIDGVASTFGYDVFEGSGGGHADAPIVYVKTAHPEDLMNVDLTGKIALVDRDASYHRATQYKNLIAKGAAAMLYVSVAAMNLRQVGSIRWTFEQSGTIPAITIGADDGKAIKDALTAAKTVHGVIDLQVMFTPAGGQNVLGKIDGSDPSGQIVIGAHYDTWFVGSSDNGGGVAALLALAERRKHEGKPRYTLVFVGYDGEEVALYGGYDYLRRHRVIGKEPILAVLNFETPSAVDAGLYGLAHSNHDALDEALRTIGHLNELYTLYTTLDVVPSLFGGIIPTDIQGDYRNGVPTASTAVNAPFYHTTQDTPDKVDTKLLASAVDGFDLALGSLLKTEPSDFAGLDAKLWTATAVARPRDAGAPLLVDVTVHDAAGAAQSGATVTGELLVDDFFQANVQTANTDADGKATLTYSAQAAEQGMGQRFVHVTSGPMYPLVEQILSLQ